MMSVLLIDDDTAFLNIMNTCLSRDNDISVTTAASAKNALDILMEKHFDAIVCDYDMPGITGIELLKRLKANKDDTPFIIYTAKNSEGVTIEAMNYGAYFYMIKSSDPAFRVEELATTIKRIVKRKRIEDELHERERDFKALVTKNVDAMIVLSRDGFIQFVNPSTTMLFDIPAEEMIGQNFGFPVILVEPVDMYVMRKFKAFVAVEMRMVEIQWEGKPSYLITLRDVTERLEYEEALRNARDALEVRVLKRTAELATACEELRSEVNERQRAEKEMEDAKAEAELYLDLMSHDINNMNQIGIGYLELLMDDPEVSEDIKESIRMPLEVLLSSSRLIENVRKLQSIKIGSLKTKPVDICEIIKDAKLHIYDTKRRIDIITECETPAIVRANDLLSDVFINLVGNAIKHSDPDKPLDIKIAVERSIEYGKEYYRCSVEDDGPGIPDELKEKLFYRLRRGQRRASGKGLGLYLIRMLVDSYHGKVWVEDRVKGDSSKGSRFVILLPAYRGGE